MKCSLDIPSFLEEFSSLFLSIVFLYFFVLITEEGFLISPGYSLELYIQMSISFLFSFAFIYLFFIMQMQIQVDSGSHGMNAKSTGATSPGNSLEMQILRPY